ncbi:hypothetical protein RJ640_003278 [Escallonia rubra]|uniref:Peptidase C1A papain C-terminal domain-containing protein n=1 Tax=Escallonia rubra TaxID=112253 RepID=A0AA88QTM4_9ASTE|nr:hypothetical protein RJ640_003278 [Escallonia rubra]
MVYLRKMPKKSRSEEEEFEGCSTVNQGFRYINRFGMRLEEFYPSTGELKREKLKNPDNQAAKIFCITLSFRGISDGPAKTNRRGKHAFLIVGQGVQAGIPYYKITNSYGQDWGEGGFGKIREDLIINISYPIKARMVMN